ncbi:RNA polymerase sigma factor [Verrucomicrobiales bacterium]|nr:RNA polymerase sigma factor [Verrucomicrobiales bacterium]
MKNDFLSQTRRSQKFQHIPLEDAGPKLPDEQTEVQSRAFDSQLAVDALQKVDETYRIALSLFYMKGFTYKEIAHTLEIPIGTVMSRLSRRKAQLKSALSAVA